MKRNILKLEIGDLVYSLQDHGMLQIRNFKNIKEVEKHWGILYCGLELSQEVLNRFWSDFIQVYHSEYTIKFDYLDENNEKKLFSFYGVYSKEKVPPMVKTNIFEEEEGMFQYFLDSELFASCYYYLNGKKVYFKYVHELQSILATRKIGRCLYGIMSCHLGAKYDLEEI